MIASWVVLPLLIIALGISRSLTSGDMRDLSYLIIMPSILLARWLLRRNVPASTWETKVNPWVLALGFASAIGLLAGAIVNSSRMMAISASGMGVVFLYFFARAIADEARLFRDPLRFLAPQEEDGLAEKPAATASRFQ